MNRIPNPGTLTVLISHVKAKVAREFFFCWSAEVFAGDDVRLTKAPSLLETCSRST